MKTKIYAGTPAEEIETVNGDEVFGVRVRPYHNPYTDLDVQLEKDGEWFPYTSDGKPVFGETLLPHLRNKLTIDWRKPVRVVGDHRVVVVQSTDYRPEGIEEPPYVLLKIASVTSEGKPFEANAGDPVIRHQDGSPSSTYGAGRALIFENYHVPKITKSHNTIYLSSANSAVDLTFTLRDDEVIDVVLTKDLQEPLDGND